MPDSLPLPTTKAELLAFMRQQWEGFVQASDRIPDDRWLEPTDAAGWNVRDHVGHVPIWIRAEIALLTDGTPIAVSTGMPQALWDAGDFDAVNAWFRATLQDRSPAEVRAERDAVFPLLFDLVSQLDDEALQRPARESGLEASDRPLLMVMSENYGLHFDDHRAQIETLGRVGT